MSTILRTLKKLEEEKSVLDQNLDITGMILHGETSPSFGVEKKRSRTFGLIVTLILTAVLIALSAVVFKIGKWKPESTALKILSRKSELSPAVASPATPPEIRKVSQTGIPLSQIPEDKTPPPTAQKPPEKSATATPAVVAAVAPSHEARRKESGVAPAIGEVDEAVAGTEAVAENEIASGNSSQPEAKINPALKNLNAIIEGGKVIPSPEPSGSPVGKPASPPRAAAMIIPGLKVKGIVYFSENNPANYILASTPDNPKGRYKVGESVQNAVLLGILPNKAIFKFKNQTTEQGIGE